MAKLSITLAHEFNAGPFLAINFKSREWNGFWAPISGSAEDCRKWYCITDWAINWVLLIALVPDPAEV